MTFNSNSCNCSVDADIKRLSDADAPEESSLIEISFKSCARPPSNLGEVAEASSKCSEEDHLAASLGQVSYRSRSLSLHSSKGFCEIFSLPLLQ